LTWNREQDELQYPIAEEFVGCKSIRVWTKWKIETLKVRHSLCDLMTLMTMLKLDCSVSCNVFRSSWRRFSNAENCCQKSCQSLYVCLFINIYSVMLLTLFFNPYFFLGLMVARWKRLLIQLSYCYLHPWVRISSASALSRF
jgi:hypothetical protein